MIKFGVTERGDAAFNPEWISAIERGDVAAAVIISKGIPWPAGRVYMLTHSEKIIFHATTTGYGGTIVEPNVDSYVSRLDQLKAFCNEGFPMNHVVIRIDPIIPTEKGIQLAKDVALYAGKLGFRRFRWSWIDLYPHVVKRFQDVGIDVQAEIKKAEEAFAAKGTSAISEWKQIKKDLFWNDFPGICFESCAEESEDAVGCISKKDFALCGLDPEEAGGRKGQRRICRCCANKTELLSERHRCPFKCLYCYWHD